MAVFGALENELTLDKSSFSRGINEAEAEMQGLDSTADSAGSKMSAMGDKMKSAGMAATVGLTAPLAAAGAKSVQLASDVEEMQSKMSVVFGKQTNEIKEWAKAQEEATGITELQYQEMATTLQDTFEPFGFAQKEATGLSKEVTSLAVDLASFNNMSTTEALDRLRGGLIGNHENLDAFGVAINQGVLDQELLAQGFKKSAEGATEQQKMMARLAIITRSTTAAQGDAARTADSFANQMKALTGQLQEAAVEIGQVLIPVLKPMVAGLRSAVTGFANLSKPVKTMIVVFGALAAALGPVLVGVGVLLTLPITGTMAAAGAAIVGLTAVVAGLAAAFGGPLISTIQSVLNALQGTFGPILSQITAAWADMDGRVQSVAASMQEAILTRLLGTVQTAGAGIQQWLSRITQFWQAHGAGVVSTITQFSTHAQEAVIQMMAAISSAFAGTGESEASFGYFFVESLNEMLAAARVLAPQIPLPIRQAITSATATIRTAVTQWVAPFSNTFDQIKFTVRYGLGVIRSLLAGNVADVRMYFSLMMSMGQRAVDSGWQLITSAFRQGATELPRIAATIPDRIVAAFRTLPAKLPVPVKQALSQASRAFDVHRQQVTTKVTQLSSLIPARYRTALSGVSQAAQSKLSEAAGKFDVHRQQVGQKVSMLRAQVGSKYQQAVNVIQQKAQSALGKATGFWERHRSTVMKAVNVIIGPVGRYGQKLGLLDKQGKLTRDGMIALGSSLLTLAGPVGIATGLAAKLGLAWQKNLFGIRTKAQQAMQGVRSAFQTYLPPIRTFIAGVLNSITMLWANTGAKWVQTFIGTGQKLADTIRTQAANWAQTIRNWVTLVVGIFRGVGAAILQIIQPLLARVAVFWRQHGEDIMFIVGALYTAVSEIFRTLFTILRDIAVTGLRIVSQLFRTFSNTLRGIIEPTVAVIGALWAKFGDELVAVIEFAFDIIVSVVGTAIDALATLIRAGMAAVDGDWTQAWNLIAGFLERTLNGIINFATSWGGRFLSWVGGLVDGVIQWFQDLYHRLIGGSIVKDIFNDIYSFIKGFDLFSAVDSLLKTAWQRFEKFGTDVLNTIKNGLGAVADWIRNDAASDLADAASNAASGAATALKNAFNNALPDELNIPKVSVGGGKIAGVKVPKASIGGQSLKIPKLATGGFVREGGLAEIHRGEEVVPAARVSRTSRTGGPQDVNVTLSVEGDDELARLIRENADVVVEDKVSGIERRSNLATRS